MKCSVCIKQRMDSFNKFVKSHDYELTRGELNAELNCLPDAIGCPDTSHFNPMCAEHLAAHYSLKLAGI